MGTVSCFLNISVSLTLFQNEKFEPVAKKKKKKKKPNRALLLRRPCERLFLALSSPHALLSPCAPLLPWMASL